MSSQLNIILVIVLPLLFLDTFLMFYIRRAIGKASLAFSEKYPAVEPSPGAIRRNFQSCSVEFVNLGFSMHLIADEDYLHARPTLLARIFGIRPTSIPWQAIQTGRFGGLRIDSYTIRIPRWCRDLAERQPQHS